MAKKSFIRATEVWLPSSDRGHLELGTGLYGPLDAFRARSEGTVFQYDEGLPGKAWAAGHPVVLKDLVNSYFLRGTEAAEAGLTCGVAVPFFAGQFLTAVLVLFCGDDEEHIGALEVWSTPEKGASRLSLVDGYFGNAEPFEFAARHTQFGRGVGLPGEVWANAMPVLMSDMGQGSRLLRWESAMKVGINRGIGIPCGRELDEPWVFTMLSALGTPIARRFECWVPDGAKERFVFHSGYSEENDDLAAVNGGASFAVDASETVKRIWRCGIPVISSDPAAEPAPVRAAAEEAGYGSLVALPIMRAGALVAMVIWYD